MTTYTTPQFATGPSERNLRLDRDALNRARPSVAAPQRSTTADRFDQGPTPDWQPGSSTGVPKAAVGALGAALVGGVALAIVLMAPSANKVAPATMPDPIAEARAHDPDNSKAVAPTDAAVAQVDRTAPATGGSTATGGVAGGQREGATTEPAPAQAVVPLASRRANAPVHHPVAPAATTRVAPAVTQQAPVVTPEAPAAATVPAPQAEPQVPAMQPTPEAPTVKSSVQDPAATDPAPATPADPAPAQ